MDCCCREDLNEGWIELGTGRDGEGDVNDGAICQHSAAKTNGPIYTDSCLAACLMGVSAAAVVLLLLFWTFE